MKEIENHFGLVSKNLELMWSDVCTDKSDENIFHTKINGIDIFMFKSKAWLTDK